MTYILTAYGAIILCATTTYDASNGLKYNLNIGKLCRFLASGHVLSPPSCRHRRHRRSRHRQCLGAVRDLAYLVVNSFLSRASAYFENTFPVTRSSSSSVGVWLCGVAYLQMIYRIHHDHVRSSDLWVGPEFWRSLFHDARRPRDESRLLGRSGLMCQWVPLAPYFGRRLAVRAARAYQSRQSDGGRRLDVTTTRVGS